MIGAPRQTPNTGSLKCFISRLAVWTKGLATNPTIFAICSLWSLACMLPSALEASKGSDCNFFFGIDSAHLIVDRVETVFISIQVVSSSANHAGKAGLVDSRLSEAYHLLPILETASGVKIFVIRRMKAAVPHAARVWFWKWQCVILETVARVLLLFLENDPYLICEFLERWGNILQYKFDHSWFQSRTRFKDGNLRYSYRRCYAMLTNCCVSYSANFLFKISLSCSAFLSPSHFVE